jgi:hypothetical protein
MFHGRERLERRRTIGVFPAHKAPAHQMDTRDQSQGPSANGWNVLEHVDVWHGGGLSSVI